MSVYLLNFYLAVFGGIITVLAFWGISMMANVIGPGYRYIKYILLVNMLYLVSVATDSFFAGFPGTNVHFLMIISNHMEYLALYGLSAAVTFYEVYLASKRCTGKFRCGVLRWYYLLPVILLGASFFTHMYFYIGTDNFYHKGSWFLLSQILGFIAQLLNLVLLIRNYRKYRKAERDLFIYFFILPIIAILFQSGKSLKFMVVATTLCCMMMFIYIIQVSKQEYHNRVLELERVRSTMTYTQLHPHFLYNSLSSISQLCRRNPQQASLLTDQLSEFLRKSTNDLNSVGLKPFDEELQHVKNYLSIDGIRYGDDLRVEYDIRTHDFQMPCFVLQQMVELLVRFDFGRSDREALIRVENRRQEQKIMVTVSCEGGPGLEVTPEQVKSFNNWIPEYGAWICDENGSNRKQPVLHMLEQLHIRLSVMQDSDLIISAGPGQPTILTIYLPEERETP